MTKDRFSYTKWTYAGGKLMSSNKELRETKTKCRGNERVSIEAFPLRNLNEQKKTQFKNHWNARGSQWKHVMGGYQRVFKRQTTSPGRWQGPWSDDKTKTIINTKTNDEES